MNITNILRKNIGFIITFIGFTLLCIITFGDLGEIVTDDYWRNVGDNLTSISFITIGLTLIQFSIRQGLAEQALQRGLNTEKTTEKYEAHKSIILECNDKIIYLPYFLQIYNKRHTSLRKQEYLINNNYCSEDSLLKSGNRRAIETYQKINVNITAASIKWSTVEVIYDKNGRIITLDEYRKRRIRHSIIASFASMIGVTFLAGGLFFSPSTEPFWQKLVKLFTYIMAIAMGSIFTVVKEYEKGAFGVPNELDEINQIWQQFKDWTIPEWVLTAVNKTYENSEVDNESETRIDGRADLSTEQEESKMLQDICTDSVVSVSDTGGDISSVDVEKFCG